MPFSVLEIADLKKYFTKFGAGHWAEILQAGAFHHSRTSVAIKDKARNLKLVAYGPAGS